MRNVNRFSGFVEWVTRKNRLSLRRGRDDMELWYIYLSPLNIFTSTLALLLILVVAVTTLVAYTNILDFVPGYHGNRSREMLVDNIMRLDSLERKLNNMQVYSDNMLLILDGKTPATRSVAHGSDSARYHNQPVVPPSREDSILRHEIERGGLFAEATKTPAVRKGLSGNELMTPVKGVVVSHFSPRDNRYGVGLATASDQPVVAVADGTVITSLLTATSGYLIQIQHSDNLISVYRRSASSLYSTGARISAGDVIGHTGQGITGEGDKWALEFELWHAGLPVDPENYIVF